MDNKAPHTTTARAAGAAAARIAVRLLARVVTGARAVCHGDSDPDMLRSDGPPRIFFANHRSHADFVLLWSVLPRTLRARTRPVAGADYWLTSPVRSFIGRDVFDALLIEREARNRVVDPVDAMAQAVGKGASLILFPEGTRNTGSDKLLPFRTGLYHLADTLRSTGVAAEFTPVWIDNLNRVLPKGETIPVPILCKVHFGSPVALGDGEDKADYLDRARDALLDLSHEDRGIR